MVRQVMVGLQRGAREAGVAVVGGETAVMPDVVKGFDLAATVIGLVKKNRIITGEETKPGDVILGLRSSGIHSNGMTLARKLLLSPRTKPRIMRELLRPTRIYVRQITKLLSSGLKIHGLVHITGGAYSKLKRIGTRANVGFFLNNIKPPWIFRVIQDKARLSDREMYRTFNMGIGFLVLCPRTLERRAIALVPELIRLGFVTDSHNVGVRVGDRVVEIEHW
jgi:phosphoribosylformylglycinamidine cyclo-ligase